MLETFIFAVYATELAHVLLGQGMHDAHSVVFFGYIGGAMVLTLLLGLGLQEYGPEVKGKALRLTWLLVFLAIFFAGVILNSMFHSPMGSSSATTHSHSSPVTAAEGRQDTKTKWRKIGVASGQKD